MKEAKVFIFLICFLSISGFWSKSLENARAQDQISAPIFLFYNKDKTISTAFKEEFIKHGFRVIDDSDLKKTKINYIRQLRDKGVQEHVIAALQEKYDDEELSKQDMGADELKVANALASALSADYYVAINYEFKDSGKDPEFGFHIVKLIVEELKVVKPNSLDTLAVFSGIKKGLGNDIKSAKIKASQKIAKSLTYKIVERVKEISRKDKTIHLVLSNVLDTRTSIKFSKIIKEITKERPKRIYNSTQHSSTYTFIFTGDKDNFMLRLIEKASTIDGIDELDIIDEQEGFSQIEIKGVLRME